MKFKFFIISIVVLTIYNCSRNERDSIKDDELPKLVLDFFEDYETFTSEKAVYKIFTSNEWISSIDKKERDSLNDRLSKITSLLGKYQSYEVIKQTNVGNSYKIVSCLAKYDRQPIRFNFILYKPVDEWQIQNFTYDFNIEEELLNAVNLSLYY